MDNIEYKMKVAFDEFKLFYDSTEKVTDRRLEANRWNYSICVATLGAIATIISWSIDKPEFLIMGLATIVLLAGMASLYCTLWIGQIRDLKELNNAKFSVLNEMAPFVAFGDDSNKDIVSFKPFEKEWEALQKAKIAQEVNSMNIIALKSSNIEYLIPKVLRAMFILIIIAAPIEGWINHDKFKFDITHQITTRIEQVNK